MKKYGCYEACERSFLAGAFHKHVKKGVLSRETFQGDWHLMNWIPTIWIPADKDYPMRLEISERGSIPMSRYERKYTFVSFYVPRGAEKDYAEFFKSVDARFSSGEISQADAEMEIANFVGSAEGMRG